ncbi:Methyltransferase-like protein 2 [Apostasia shenzhenica]|uniref:Methyltransferase-like protein 2 n=1 Tax=Apostasia shenzhenica TaxID=1088818 RepID=A0A2I0ADK5_9ASPA|nr:Methyltransferase-like protein 2 [Apostasia shenzhenica]
MEGKGFSEELCSFLESGIYRLPECNAVFVDPVRVLNCSYSGYKVSASRYYSRTFDSCGRGRGTSPEGSDSFGSKKGNRKKRKRPVELNEKELVAEKRHQELRPFLVEAHDALLGTPDLLNAFADLMRDEHSSLLEKELEQDFVEIGSLWQAPLYEISLHFGDSIEIQDEGLQTEESSRKRVVPIFNNLISNNTSKDMVTEFLNWRYIVPNRSSFYMSDLRQIHGVIPACSDQGFSLIVIDPPWENGSAHQKALYPTLPNRHLIYLPIQQLVHTEGALLVLWMTNREKLRCFIEKELFPAWAVSNIQTFYWLKVKPNGSLLGQLDLFHHRPYEHLLIGYVEPKKTAPESRMTFKNLPDKQVIISIPGAYSRKPPLGKLLEDFVPGPKPSRCLELFARELVAGWTSWGNEVLRFQDSTYFCEKSSP